MPNNSPASVAIKAQLLIDAVAEAPLRQPLVLVEAGRIAAIGQWPQMQAPPGVEVVDCADLTLMPGFIEAHSHTQMDARPWIVDEIVATPDAVMLERSLANLRTATQSGVTTLRDNAARPGPIFDLKRRLADGTVEGPRLLASGAAITRTEGHCWFLGRIADDDDSVRLAVQEQIALGADFVKVMATGGNMTPTSSPRQAQFNLRQLQIIVDEAHEAGRRVSAHAHGTAGIRLCVQAGIDSIDHCSWLGADEGFEFDPAVVDEMARRGLFAIPTLSVIVERYGHQPEVMAQRAAHLHAMIEAGVAFAAGSDAGTRDVPFGRPWHEMQLLAEAGLSPLDAIRAGTSEAARCLGIDSTTGRVEAGKDADLVAVAGNPLEDLAALRAVRLVMKQGSIVHDTRNTRIQ